MNEAMDIVTVDAVDARIEPFDWPFVRDRRADIDAHWEAVIREKPKMFNGQVLLQHRADIRDGIFHAGYFATDYASLVAWMHLGMPPPLVRNGFAMAALRASDGAYLLGEMASHTTHAGKIYFAAGTPDLSDVTPDGHVDLAGSLLRELQEETGLARHEVSVEESWTLVMGQGRVAFMRPVTIDLPASEARALMLERIAAQAEPELAGIVIIRSAEECDQERMPPFMRRYLRHMLPAGQPG